jgi:hypothetical protein
MRFLAKKRTPKIQLNIFAARTLTMIAHFTSAEAAAFPKNSFSNSIAYTAEPKP